MTNINQDSWLDTQKFQGTSQMWPQHCPAEGLGEVLAQDARPPPLTQGQAERLASYQWSHTVRLRPLTTSCKPQELQVAKARAAAQGLG